MERAERSRKCPGKKSCSRQKIERGCRGCPHLAPEPPAADLDWLPWIAHLSALSNALELGFTITLADVSPREFRGLVIFSSVRNRVMERKQKRE